MSPLSCPLALGQDVPSAVVGSAQPHFPLLMANISHPHSDHPSPCSDPLSPTPSSASHSRFPCRVRPPNFPLPPPDLSGGFVPVQPPSRCLLNDSSLECYVSGIKELNIFWPCPRHAGQGSNPRHSSNISHSSDNAEFLTTRPPGNSRA